VIALLLSFIGSTLSPPPLMTGIKDRREGVWHGFPLRGDPVVLTGV
jgi:hypothetical protein